ncbi:MAG: hypothetical protein IJS69_04640 [Selenomonadaceae bacterium]|nr:hypothetical protein [Selenomonadaceae bacterium]
MTKHLLKIFLLATFIVAAVQSTTLALSEPLEIVNETGQPIMSLYVVPMQKKDWGNDLVGSGVMNQGDKRSITYDSEFALYKIKVEFTDGKTITRNNVDLLNTWRLSIRRDGSFDKNTRG